MDTEPRLQPVCFVFSNERTDHGGKRAGPQIGRSDHYPADYGVRDRDDAEKKRTKNKSWEQGDKGQGREGLSKGYGGSEGEGTGASGPDEKKR